MSFRSLRNRGRLGVGFRSRLACCLIGVTLAACQGPAEPPRDPHPGFPRAVIWAWERPERLEFLDPAEAGVAFLGTTLTLSGPELLSRPRQQPLKVPPGTALMAVARIEVDPRRAPALSVDQRERAAAAIARLAGLPQVAALQVDFDATASQRAFYREMLEALRRAMPPGMPLSITALTSWCLHDGWLDGLPIDDAIPLLFRMGGDRPAVLRHLEAGRDFRSPLCRQSVGISTDEPMPHLPEGRRAFIFHPRAWTGAASRRALDDLKRWQ